MLALLKMKIDFWIKISTILFVIFSLTALIGFILFFVFSFSSSTTLKIPEIKGEKSLIVDSNKNFSNTLINNDDKKIKIAFWGDLMIDRHVKTKIDKYGVDYLFTKIATSSQWQDAAASDLMIANLEGAVTDSGEHYPPTMAYDFAFVPERVAELKNYGFNAFTIANNHLADQGENGIIETDKNLEKLGFFYFGCADRQTGKCSSAIKKIGNKNVGFVGASMVYGQLDETELLVAIKELASNTDLTIVEIHWGTEYKHQFDKVQQDLAHKIVDAGADVIIGHHPHVVQGMEIYEPKRATTNGAHANIKKGIIFYSLGNFIFDQYFSADTQEGLAVAITLTTNYSPVTAVAGEGSSSENVPLAHDDRNGRGARGEGEGEITLFPIKSKSSQAQLMSGQEKEKFLNKTKV